MDYMVFNEAGMHLKVISIRFELDETVNYVVIEFFILRSRLLQWGDIRRPRAGRLEEKEK